MDNGGLVIGSRYLGGMAEMEDLRLNCYHRAVRVSPALCKLSLTATVWP